MADSGLRWSQQGITCPYCSGCISFGDLSSHLTACQTRLYDRVRAELVARGELSEDVADLFAPSPEVPALDEADDSNDSTSAPEHTAPSSQYGHEVAPRLFLGSVSAALDSAWLRERRVTAIINCADEVRPLSDAARFASGVTVYHKLPIDDVSSRDYTALIAAGSRHVADAFASIDSDASVLVHCAMGVSRSAAVVMAFLVMHQRMPLARAASMVRARRAIVYPNVGFWRSLRNLERTALQFSSVPAAALRLHTEMLLAENMPPPPMARAPVSAASSDDAGAAAAGTR